MKRDIIVVVALVLSILSIGFTIGNVIGRMSSRRAVRLANQWEVMAEARGASADYYFEEWKNCLSNKQPKLYNSAVDGSTYVDIRDYWATAADTVADYGRSGDE